jgi:tetratricopeptide (TPR) repeat protein
VQIATARGDAQLARQLLELLSQVDRPEFAAHRRSRVEDAFGNSQGAYQAAQEAVGQSSRPPFAILAQLALMAIKTGRKDEAQRQLNRLDDLYPRIRRDIRRGLRCRAAIARGEYDDALGHWERLEDKTRPVHLALRVDALRGKLEHTSLSDETAQEIQAELAQLDARLARASPQDLELF